MESTFQNGFSPIRGELLAWIFSLQETIHTSHQSGRDIRNEESSD
jgi:hypothetical protein